MAILCIDEKVWTLLVGKIESLAAIARQLERHHGPRKGDDWIDSQEVCLALKISKRTLQTYRENGLMPFSTVGGKYFYRDGDVAAFLESKTNRKKV